MVSTLAEMRKISRCIVSIVFRVRISINFILFLSLYCTSFLSRFPVIFIATRRAVSGRLSFITQMMALYCSLGKQSA